MYEEIPNLFLFGFEELQKYFPRFQIFRSHVSTPEKMFPISILGLAVVTGVRRRFGSIKINAKLDKSLSWIILVLTTCALGTGLMALSWRRSADGKNTPGGQLSLRETPAKFPVYTGTSCSL